MKLKSNKPNSLLVGFAQSMQRNCTDTSQGFHAS